MVNDSAVIPSSQKQQISQTMEHDAEVVSNTQLEKLVADEPPAVQAEILRINTHATNVALQVGLLIPILAGLLGLLNSFRMMRLPEIEPSEAVEAAALGRAPGRRRATSTASDLPTQYAPRHGPWAEIPASHGVADDPKHGDMRRLWPGDRVAAEERLLEEGGVIRIDFRTADQLVCEPSIEPLGRTVRINPASPRARPCCSR